MSCNHVIIYKTKYGLNSYKTIYSFFVKPNFRTTETTPKILLSCFNCGDEFNRLFGCLFCIYLGCFEDHVENHLQEKGHELYVEISNGFIYCTDCKDYVYDRDFEEVAANLRGTDIIIDPYYYCKWQPSENENVIISRNRKFISLIPNKALGIRGIYNFGLSCYMNCVMQALMHTSLLRDFFFSDKHKCHSPQATDCIVCHFYKIFQWYYSEEISILSLHELFFLIWQRARHLSGNMQKDAHEFFSAVLDLLHQDSSPNQINNGQQCKCIIDLTFYGELQSDLVCQTCSNISTTVDPIWDVSLDIPDLPILINLFECLNQYTRKESLDLDYQSDDSDNKKMICDSCQTCQWTKQLTFWYLPTVIVIHLKRFISIYKKGEDKTTTIKNNTYVNFPLELDMSPFITECRTKMPTENANSNSDVSYKNHYKLYAVIEHRGKTLDSGHYLAYIRPKFNEWYKCNDSTVQPIQVKDVMKQEAYMLFYHRSILPYEV